MVNKIFFSICNISRQSGQEYIQDPSANCTSLVFFQYATSNLNNCLYWGWGGNLFLIVFYILPAAHTFYQPTAYKVWLKSSKRPASCHIAHVNPLTFVVRPQFLISFLLQSTTSLIICNGCLPPTNNMLSVLVSDFIEHQGQTSLNYNSEGCGFPIYQPPQL